MSFVPSEAAGDLVTSETAADILRCAPRTVRLLAQNGSIPATRVHPRLWLFDRADVEAFAASRNPEPAA